MTQKQAKVRARMCIKGDTETPQRYWVCVVTDDPSRIKRLIEKGYATRLATDTEIARTKDIHEVCNLGKIGDQFFQ